MADVESKNTLVSGEDTVSSVPLTICTVVFRLKRSTLTMQELTKFATALLTVFVICAIAVLFMRPSLENAPLGRWFVVLSILPTCILYVFMYLNLATGPWGSESSRFWCDVRIMYTRGFNTIRTVLNMFSNSLLLIFLCVLLGHTGPLVMQLIFVTSLIAEWQSGAAEHVNQTDIKVYDRFMDGDVLCLEALHYYQSKHPIERVRWTPYVLASTIKFYVVTSILCTAKDSRQVLVFQIPIAIAIVMYTCLSPLVLHFVYFKGFVTFSQLELYRTVLDIVFPMLILSFSLV